MFQYNEKEESAFHLFDLNNVDGNSLEKIRKGSNKVFISTLPLTPTIGNPHYKTIFPTRRRIQCIFNGANEPKKSGTIQIKLHIKG